MTKDDVEDCRALLKELLLAMADLGASMGKEASDVALVRSSTGPEVDALCDLALKGLERAKGVPLIASHLRDFAEFLPENKREDFNATIDDLVAQEGLPAEPTYAMLKALAGEPLLLSASHEQYLRRLYQAMLRCAGPDGNRNG